MYWLLSPKGKMIHAMTPSFPFRLKEPALLAFRFRESDDQSEIVKRNLTMMGSVLYFVNRRSGLGESASPYHYLQINPLGQ